MGRNDCGEKADSRLMALPVRHGDDGQVSNLFFYVS